MRTRVWVFSSIAAKPPDERSQRHTEECSLEIHLDFIGDSLDSEYLALIEIHP